MSERPTFSPMWHRVRTMRPRLRPHTQVTRQHYRGRLWYVVHDPASNQFYRLSPVAHEFVALLDGRRSVEEAWNASLEAHADDAPTQGEIVELLSQLYNANLLAGDAAPEVEQLLRRGRERLKKRAAQQAIGIMYFRVRVFNPDPVLAWLEPVLRPLINPVGLALWAALVAWGLAAIVGHADELRAEFEGAITLGNAGWIALVFIVAKAWHEIGHGVICKRLGGQVPELGFMLLVLFPAPYVDASSCWAFPRKWSRVAVGAGGMIFELALASVAALYWRSTLGDPAALGHRLAYNAMLTASISTILFNANPLMRFDGYYILADLIEVPNLMQRSMNMLRHLARRHIYRLMHARSPTTSRAEGAILVVYGVLALAYRVFLFITITLLVMGKLFAVGLVLALWTAAAWFVLPLGKFVQWLASAPELADRRGRALLTTGALVTAAAVLLGGIPLPDHRRASGVIESLHRSGVFFGTSGFVDEVLARPGDRVKEGQVLVACSSPLLAAQLDDARVRLEAAEAAERDTLMRTPELAVVLRDRAATLATQIGYFEDRVDRLAVRAPHAGVLVGPDPALMLGSFAREGTAIGEVIEPRLVRVAASLQTLQAGAIFDAVARGEGFEVRLRLRSDPGTTLHAGRIELLEAGQLALPHAALGMPGGGSIATEPEDRRGMVARRPQFIMRVSPPEGRDAWTGIPGERVEIRLVLRRRPLAAQWLDRIVRAVQERVKL